MSITEHAAPATQVPSASAFTQKNNTSVAPPPEQGFVRSRIYAQGWNAARKRLNIAQNPYRAGPDQALWLEGYHARGI
jgi:hypothetical protein